MKRRSRPEPTVKHRSRSEWLHPGWSWTIGRAWVITPLSALGTLLLGALLGALPAVLTGSWNQVWILAVFAGACLAAFAAAMLVSRKRRSVQRKYGTAYVVREFAADWARQDEKAFLDSAGRYFARVIKVPGPGKLGRRTWEWPLGDGARDWDAKLTELVWSFLALHSDDDPRTPNGILMWAWWAVAAAFGLRVSAIDRDLVLDVWQRPSHGRAGLVKAVIGARRPLRFGDASPRPPAEFARREFTWPAELTITPRASIPAAGIPAAGGPVSVLLLRLGDQRWGPLPALEAEPDPGSKHVLKIEDAAGITTGGSADALIHELRYVPPQGGKFPLRAFPSLVAAAADWIERKTSELNGRTLLLGTTMPAEAALGFGISAGQFRRADRWPRTMWPLIYPPSGDVFVVPRLNLGTAWEERCRP